VLGATPRATRAALTSWGVVCDDASGLFVFCKDLTDAFIARPWQRTAAIPPDGWYFGHLKMHK
jgi:hypothetical protein